MVRSARSVAAALLAAGLVLPAATAAATSSGAERPVAGPTLRAEVRVTPRRDAALAASIGARLNVVDPSLVELDGLPAEAAAFAVPLPIDGAIHRVDLAPHSVRSASHYRLLVDEGAEQLREVEPGAERTVRGTVDGMPAAAAAGGLVGGGLKLVILHGDGRRTILEPVGDGLHAIYDAAGVVPMPGHACGNEAVAPAEPVEPAPADAGSPVAGGTLDVAELACDADFEYFQDYGSVAEVEARIATVINTVNQQYESQVGITHELTTIIVRTTSTDPYTAFDSFGLLCQFITEWTDNQASAPRDVAHLFTGRNVDGGTIGRAADIGQTGICVNEGGCSGGQFGTFGSYCFAESDFNGNFVSATDLTAHELGHLWGAFHCNCTSFTMNPFITSANQFSSGSISSIVAYRNTRTCLNVPSEPEIPGPCCLPNNVCIIAPFESECVDAGGTFLGPDADCADCAGLVGACCLPTGACVQLDEATCDIVGGVFAGNGTSCGDTSCGAPCPADIDGDGDVAFSDLLSVLAVFGPCGGCPEDVDADGEVAFSDLLAVLSAFGPCP